MVGSSNFESKSIRPKVIPKTTTQTSPGLATTDPLIASQCTLVRRPVMFHYYLTVASTTGDPQDPMLIAALLLSRFRQESSDPRHLACLLCLTNSNTTVPSTQLKVILCKLEVPLPYSTAFPCPSVFRGLKNPNFPPPNPKQNKRDGGGGRKRKKQKEKNTLVGPFMQIMCSAFLF